MIKVPPKKVFYFIYTYVYLMFDPYYCNLQYKYYLNNFLPDLKFQIV